MEEGSLYKIVIPGLTPTDRIEMWHPVEGFDGYCISTLGRVYSCITQKILSPSVDRDGYRRIYLYKNGKQVGMGINRLVAIAFLSNPENLPVVHHKDRNRSNDTLSNLEWVSHKTNMHESMKAGTHKKPPR